MKEYKYECWCNTSTFDIEWIINAESEQEAENLVKEIFLDNCWFYLRINE